MDPVKCRALPVLRISPVLIVVALPASTTSSPENSVNVFISIEGFSAVTSIGVAMGTSKKAQKHEHTHATRDGEKHGAEKCVQKGRLHACPPPLESEFAG